MSLFTAGYTRNAIVQGGRPAGLRWKVVAATTLITCGRCFPHKKATIDLTYSKF